VTDTVSGTVVGNFAQFRCRLDYCRTVEVVLRHYQEPGAAAAEDQSSLNRSGTIRRARQFVPKLFPWPGIKFKRRPQSRGVNAIWHDVHPAFYTELNVLGHTMTVEWIRLHSSTTVYRVSAKYSR